MINWIPTRDRLPTDDEHSSGVVALWIWENEQGDYDRHDMEMTHVRPVGWGQLIRMPTYWAKLRDFNLPQRLSDSATDSVESA